MPTKRGSKSKSKSPSPHKAKGSSPKKSSPDTTTKAEAMGKRKREESNTTHDNPNADICDLLMELAEYEKTGTGEKFKHQAYRKAAQILAEQKTRIQSGAEAKKLEGIGESIAAKIDEYLESGRMEKVEEARDDDDAKILAELARVPGIGHARAKDLYDQGIKSIEELKKHPELLSEQQKKSLGNLDAIEAPITKQKTDKIKKYVEQQLKEMDGRFKVTVCGASRRHEPTVLEFVAVISHSSSEDQTKDHVHELSEKLQKSGFLDEVISEGDHRIKGICELADEASPKNGERSSPRKKAKSDEEDTGVSSDDKGKGKHGERHMVLLAMYPTSQEAAAVLHWTGNDVFVQEMSSKAKAKGFLLNEFGLYRNRGSGDRADNMVKVDNEEDIFKELDMDYVKPEDRNV